MRRAYRWRIALPMKPIDDPLTLATMQTTTPLTSKVALDAVDLECRSRSVEALAISRELLAVPLYRPLRGMRPSAPALAAPAPQTTIHRAP